MRVHVGDLNDGHAEVRMTEVEAHLDSAYFCWMGETKDSSAASRPWPTGPGGERAGPAAPPPSSTSTPSSAPPTAATTAWTCSSRTLTTTAEDGVNSQ
ncbi:hypothetical protein [Streptomyces sp. SAS_276]|uniref:hypothetical protein n=1 Tax=Streptomyces sp. SAS_276 TaxID=3412745 RepID=UPI00403CAB19